MEIHLGMFGPLRSTSAVTQGKCFGAEWNFSTYSNVLTLKQNKLHPEQAKKLVHIYQNHQIWDRKESKTSCSSATWTRGEFDIPKENDSLVVGGNGTGHTTIGFRSYAKVYTDDSMPEVEDDDFNQDSGLRLSSWEYAILCNDSEISGSRDDMDQIIGVETLLTSPMPPPFKRKHLNVGDLSAIVVRKRKIHLLTDLDQPSTSSLEQQLASLEIFHELPNINIVDS
ncbi:hypothetical protein SELMODRAFT_406729 [Selaginella moellendorffii]|uniref:Uncharacterized protein n=1 Tax=Selaginella moellendorffii TaxID=88036 RepID=D8R198_SELML|nr:hypothetical protein SELMODRAFT_406729 [Selaginella moellendorffii]